jgi:tetratricopeptide (TPR) repeat protein
VAQRELILKTVMMVTLIAFLGVGFAVAGDGNKNEAAADMEWGYKAARRGYWQEALMRFEHANELTPDQPRILNNIAVAQEANGLYEQALLTYQTGLEIAPNSEALRRNYMRFQEFYTSYIAKPEVGAETESEEQEADDAQEND